MWVYTPNAKNWQRRGEATVSKDIVRATFQEDGAESVRSVSRRTGVNRSSVQRILQENLMPPNKFVRLHLLYPADLEKRVEYSRWLMGEESRNPSFCKYILWTDETLHKRRVFQWSQYARVVRRNSRALRIRQAQVRFSVNLWAGICGEVIVGPYILPDRLNGAALTSFLRNVLSELLDDVPLEIRQNMCFQMDGAPTHYAANVRAHFSETFRNRCIGRLGLRETGAWPPRSPDMNPMDFYFWDYLKNEMYREPVDSLETLLARIHGAVASISVDTLRRVQQEIQVRADWCIRITGSNFKQFLRIQEQF
ncbi:uncharacterized protein LOC143259442 [Megalopta genalis]|uniref:uncharacterized protein LOC143259442 n=1 Tax=Megalopta genalis TaxID=115081 RepID=UPI003FD4EC75